MFKTKLDVRSMTYIALLVALHIVLEYIFKIIPGQPQGGNITLSLLPIFIGAYLMGAGYGVIIGAVCCLIQFALGLASYWGYWSVLLDYLLPLMVIGLAPIFKKLEVPDKHIYTGIIITMVLKYFIHVLSGGWLFGAYAPEGMNPWIYSLGYNLFYNLGTLVITYIAFIYVYPRLEKSVQFKRL